MFERDSRDSRRGGSWWLPLVLLTVLTLVAAACGGPSGTGAGGSGAPSASVGGAGTSTGGSEPSTETTAEATSEATSEGTAEATSEATSEATAEASGDTSAAPSGGTGVSPIEPPATAVTLDYWNPFTGGDGDTMSALVQQFNEETENVEIVEQRTPDYDTQINLAAENNALPEVLILRIDTIALRAAEGQVQPLDALSSQLGLSADQFTEAVWDATFWKDQQYSIPLDVHTATLFYNKALFTAANLDPESPPTDRASFEAALTALKESSVTGPVWSNHFFSASLFWASLFYQGGGEWTNADNTAVTFNSQAAVDASSYMRGLIEAGLHPQDVEADAEVTSFQARESGMAITGIWQTVPFRVSLGEDFGAAPIPQIFAGPGVWAGSHTLAVTKDVAGDELQGAYYFIDWLTNHSLEWAAGGQIPARLSVREDPAFAGLEDIPDIAQQVDAARFPPAFPGSGEMLGGTGGVTEKLLEILVGGGDPKPGLDDAAATYTEILSETKTKYDF